MTIRLSVKKVYFVAILLIVLLGGFLRFNNLGVKEFSSTELNTVLTIELSFFDMAIDRLKLGTIPFYYVLLKLFTKIFGVSEFSLRFFSAFLGTLSVYVIFLIGRFVFNSKVALIAAFLFSVSRNHLFFSQWARANSACLFFLLVSIYFFMQAVSKNENGFWKKYTLFRIIALYLYGFPIFISLAEFLHMIIFCKDKEKIKKFLFSTALIVVFLLPFWISIIFLIPQTAQESGYIYIQNLPSSETLRSFYLAWGNSHLFYNRTGGRLFLYPMMFLSGIIICFIRNKLYGLNLKRNVWSGSVTLSGFVFLWFLSQLASFMYLLVFSLNGLK